MKEYSLDITVDMPFGNLFRKEHVLIVVLDDSDKVLVGLKPGFMPDGVGRLLGGGVKKQETPIEAAVRELNEEVGVLVEEKDFKKMFQVNSHAVDSNGNEYNTTTYVYFYRLKNSEYRPGDDVLEIAKLTLEDLKELAAKYESFDNNFWYEGNESKHKWADYGKLYGPIHKWAYEYLVANIKK